MGMSSAMHKGGTVRTALIDADIPLYQCAAKGESDGETAEQIAMTCVEKFSNIAFRAKCSKKRIVFSGPGNFRKDLCDVYKRNRGPKPEAYLEAKELLVKWHGSEVCQHPRLEADDLLGIMATNGLTENPIICTIDKDLLQIPGWHFNFGHHHYEGDDFPRYINEATASKNLFLQLLTGDSTDAIVGIKRMGPVGANRCLEMLGASIGNQAESISVASQVYVSNDCFDDFARNLAMIYIWRKPMDEALLSDPIISEVASTIKSLR